MNRQLEYQALCRSLEALPPALDGVADRVRRRVRQQKKRRLGVSFGSVAAAAAGFVLAVNLLPTFALACGRVPVLRELAAAVAFSPSLSAAVANDYGQAVGQSQTVDGMTLTLDSVIADERQVVAFYRADTDLYTQISCEMTDQNGAPLQNISCISGSDSDDVRQFEIHAIAGQEIPAAFCLRLSLKLSDDRGETVAVYGPYVFELTLDRSKSAPERVLTPDQTVELDGQRLTVETVRLNLTRTAVTVSTDPANTAWLVDLDFHFVGPDGTVYDVPDGSLAATGSPDTPEMLTYYWQSLYFTGDPTDLRLVLDGTLWLEKDAAPVVVDLTDGGVQGTLPEGVASVTVASVADAPEIRVAVEPGVELGQPFRGYLDHETGEERFFPNGMSYHGPGGDWAYAYPLPDFPYNTIALAPRYSFFTEADVSLTLPAAE